jgi:hypothetical protein
MLDKSKKTDTAIARAAATPSFQEAVAIVGRQSAACGRV